MNNIAFVPGNCEVINLENKEQFFRVWDSGFEAASAGMCKGNSNPLGFTVLQEPNESNAFYGLTYRGMIILNAYSIILQYVSEFGGHTAEFGHLFMYLNILNWDFYFRFCFQGCIRN